MNKKLKQHKDINMLILDYCMLMDKIGEVYEVDLTAPNLLLFISKFRVFFNSEVINIFKKHKQSIIFLLTNQLTTKNIEEYTKHLRIAFVIIGEILSLADTELMLKTFETEDEFDTFNATIDNVLALMNMIFED